MTQESYLTATSSIRAKECFVLACPFALCVKAKPKRLSKFPIFTQRNFPEDVIEEISSQIIPEESRKVRLRNR